jgi:hypothetical protein
MAQQTKLQCLPFFAAKKAVRIISRAKFRDHTNPLFVNLEILQLDQLVTNHRLYCKFMHNYYFRKLPPSFLHLWQTNVERNPVRELRNANDYTLYPHTELNWLNVCLSILFLQLGMLKMMKNLTPPPPPPLPLSVPH